MKNVRLFYTKKGRMKFVSHLDMNRFMIRTVRKAKLPIWYTEGFNPHPYITFALPLSLGFQSSYEIMDIRLTDDNYDINGICEKLNAVCPEYIEFFDACEPILKTRAVAFAHYNITFDDNKKILSLFLEFLNKESITVSKKTKKGDIKQFDILPKIKDLDIKEKNGNTHLSLTLPAGSTDNVNPELLITAFYEQTNTDYYCYSVERDLILDENLKPFR
ncbi:MAG: TIGR03936 family radical SAM-associated protein [Clostridia bacterium]|nr:TIGR03936 family radical SAM-associated protein [Clostridia bacterium]